MGGTEEIKIELEKKSGLKEKVFFICDYLQNSEEKITRDKVRLYTGGSDRDLSKLIREWKEQSAITVQGSQQVSTNSGTQQAENIDLEGEQVFTKTPDNDVNKLARRAAERAAALIVGEDAVTQYLLENPDHLPEDLKEKVWKSKQKIADTAQQRQEKYNPDFFAQNAIAALKQA